MIGYGESSKRKAVFRINDFLKLRKQCRIGLLNIKTLLQPGKLAEVSKEMDNYSINIFGLSECRWLRRGKFSIPTENKVRLCSSTEKGGQEGVGLLLDKTSKNCLTKFESISGRLLRAGFQTTHFKLTIFQVYTPTEEHDEDTKCQFYNQLQNAVQKMPRHDIGTVVGNLNTKIGSKNEGYEEILSKHSVDASNNNSLNFVN